MTRLNSEQESDAIAQCPLMWDHVRLDRESTAKPDIFRKQKRTTFLIQMRYLRGGSAGGVHVHNRWRKRRGNHLNIFADKELELRQALST